MAIFSATRPVGSPLGPASQFAISTCVLFIATSAAILAKPWLGEGYASLLFVVGIMVIGAVSGLVRAVITAIVGAAAFNFYVVDRYMQFEFTSWAHFAPPLVFLFCAILSGVLSGRLRDQTHQSWLANTRLESLLNISRDMQPANTAVELRSVLQQYLPHQDELAIRLCWQIDGVLRPVGPAQTDVAWLAALSQIDQPATAHQGPTLRKETITDGIGEVGAFVYETGRLPYEDIAFVAALARLASQAFTRRRLNAEIAETRALAKSEELKTALLSSVSHDLRTPLTTIATAASSMLTFEDRIDAETRHDLLTNIVEECGRLNHLTDNLLQMGRLQAGSSPLSGSVLVAQDMIRRCVARMRSQGDTREFVIDVPPDDVVVLVDTALFELALINVLQNAVKYSADGTTVTARCTVQDGACVIAVTDQGIGVPADEQARVFERFYRVGASGMQGSGPKGSGLGLAIAKGFVEASGGSIVLTSPTDKGRGTTITIRRPRAQEEPMS